MMKFWIVSVLFMLGLSDLAAANPEDEARLKDLLFSHYDETVAPETPLVLTYSATLHKLVDVNPDKGLITADIILHHSWHDRRLVWNPEDFNVTDQSIIVPRGRVFLPDMELQNGLATELVSDPDVIIYSNGGTNYAPYVRAEVYCDLPSKPFEGHICNVRFGPWTRTSSRITVESFTADDTSLQSGGRCTLGQSEANVVRQVFACCPETYEVAILSLNVSCQAPENNVPVSKVNVTCQLTNPSPNSAVKNFHLFPYYFFVAPIYIIDYFITKLV